MRESENKAIPEGCGCIRMAYANAKHRKGDIPADKRQAVQVSDTTLLRKEQMPATKK